MKHAYKQIRAFLRKPLVAFIIYPILIYWLFFSAFPAALDGGAEQGAIVFTLCILVAVVLMLKLILIPVSLLAQLEIKLMKSLKNRGINYTPVRLRFRI